MIVIEDIIDELKEINKMIDLHCNDEIDIMLSQYQSKRDRLILELEEEIKKLK
jgi:polyhydroxyalkanoate synthesis regulator phasin